MSHRMFDRALSVAVVLGLLCGLVGCATQPSPTATPEPEAAATTAPASTTAPTAAPTAVPEPAGPQGTLTLAMARAIESLDPPGSLSVGNWTVSMTMFDPLVTVGADGAYVPMLATEWENPDPLTWKFTLRQGVKFHDGEPFTSESVKHTLDYIVNAENKTRLKSYWGSYDHTETPDEYTAVIKTKTPVGTMLSNLAITMMLPPKAAKPMSEMPVGTGPFKFVEWIVDDHLTVEANLDYWQGAPKLEKIVFRSIKEQTTRVSALLSGQVDLIDQVLPEQVATIKPDSGVTIIEQPTTFIRMLWLQGGTKPLDDNRVRQAIKYAIDTSVLVDSIMQGAAETVDGCVAKDVFGYVKQAGYSYDPAKAKELLAEAGYPNGIDLELKFGAELYPKQREIADTIAAQLGQVGIRVKVTPQDQALWIEDLLALKWDMEIVGASSPALDGDDPLRRLYLSTSKRLTWSSSVLDELLLAQQAETDATKRLQYFADICELLYGEGPVVYLFNDVEIYGVSGRVQGFVPSSDQTFRLYNVSVK